MISSHDTQADGTSTSQGSTLRALELAGAASLGAGAIHAVAAGVHSEHLQAVYAFTAVAVFQLAWGAIALVRSSRWFALVGAVGNAAIFGGWVLSKTTGIGFVDGLTEAEVVQAADGLAAGLALVASVIAMSSVVSPRVRSSPMSVTGGLMAVAVLAFTVPAMAASGDHAHSGADAHGDSTATAEEAGHAHGTEGTDEPESSGHAHGDEDAPVEEGADPSAPGVIHEHGEAVAVTGAELEAAARLVADTKVGVEPFEELAAAEAAGYYRVAPPRNGLVHYMNTQFNADGLVLDPGRPESLIYLDMTDGTWMLVGAMYRMPAPDQPGPRVGGALTAWHAHDNLCRAEGRVVAVAVDGVCTNGELGNTPEMLHVWLVDNPAGVFSDDMEPAGLLDIVQAER